MKCCAALVIFIDNPRKINVSNPITGAKFILYSIYFKAFLQGNVKKDYNNDRWME